MNGAGGGSGGVEAVGDGFSWFKRSSGAVLRSQTLSSLPGTGSFDAGRSGREMLSSGPLMTCTVAPPDSTGTRAG